MKVSKIRWLLSLLTLGALASAVSAAGPAALPFPTAGTPEPVDLGALETHAADTPVSITVALSLQNVDAAEALLQAVSTPGNSQYQQFLTADQFVARFAPTKSTVTKAIAAFAKYGLTAVQTTATTLQVSGLPANIQRA